MEQQGPTIFVVEDEAMVAMDLVDCITDAGYRVLGPVDNLPEALRIGVDGVFDAALLDANLRGKRVDDLAAVLTRRNIPYAFVTGYARETLPPPFRHVTIVAKPYTHDRIKETLKTLLPGKSVQHNSES